MNGTFIRAAAAAIAALLVGATPLAHSEALMPHDDAQVIEVLPAGNGSLDIRRLRDARARRPHDAEAAVALARRELDLARSQGDPRLAGQALGALRAWPDPATEPDAVLLMRATIEQYLHDFDTAAEHLELLLKRQPRSAQAWLTLATVRRVQGRYDDSDSACAGVGRAGSWFYAQACKAENDGLRGDVDAARTLLQRLMRTPRLDAATMTWLLTTLAELEARAGQAMQAEADYRQALAASGDSYTVLSFADFLIVEGHCRDAASVLQGQRRSDAVLLRLAVAGARCALPGAARDADEWRERSALANQRPEVRQTHAREQAMFALWVDEHPKSALDLARTDVRRQREPIDLLLLAAAARAAGDSQAVREAASLQRHMGLHDERLDALL